MINHEQPQPISVDPALLELLDQPDLESSDRYQVAAMFVQGAALYEHESVRLMTLSDGALNLAKHITVHGVEKTLKHLLDGGLPTESIALEEAAKNRATTPVAEPLDSEPLEELFAPWKAFVSDGKSPVVQGPRNIPPRSAATGEQLETESEYRIRVAGHLAEERGDSPSLQFLKKWREAMGFPDLNIGDEKVEETLFDMDDHVQAAEDAYEAGELAPPDPSRAIQREAFANAQARGGSITPKTHSQAAGGTRLPT